MVVTSCTGPTCVFVGDVKVFFFFSRNRGRGFDVLSTQMSLLCVKCPRCPCAAALSIREMCTCMPACAHMTQLYCSTPVIHLFRLSQVLPWLLQTHCCLFFEKDSGKVWGEGMVHTGNVVSVCESGGRRGREEWGSRASEWSQTSNSYCSIH